MCYANRMFPFPVFEVGEWFEIADGMCVALNHRYQITYTMQDNRQSEPICWCRTCARRVGVNEACIAMVHWWTARCKQI